MGVVQKRRIILDFLGQFGINNENLFKINNWLLLLPKVRNGWQVVEIVKPTKFYLSKNTNVEKD
jgi:hypothetical protein